MKSIRLVLAAVMAIAASVRAQVVDASVSPEPVVAPVASPATACILGDLQDGTPPPPQPPQPVFSVPAKNVLATTTHQQGGRSITIRRIKPIALPPPPEPAPVLAESALQEDPSEIGEPHPTWDLMFMGASVFRRVSAQLQREAELKANPPRPKNITLNYWRTERPAPAKGGAK